MIGEGMIGGATTEASEDLLEVTGMAEATDMVVEARTGGAVVASGVEEGTRAQEKLPRMDGDTPSSERERERKPKSSRRSRSRSRSGSPPPRPPGSRMRKTLFDVGPGGVHTPRAAMMDPAFAAQMLGAPASGSGFGPVPAAALGMLGGGLSQAQNIAAALLPQTMHSQGGSSGGGGQQPSQQATRHARRVYVGGLPPTANEQSIATFFSHALSAVGGNTLGPGNAVVNVYINREKNFAFVEFRTVEETSNAMALDSIMFEGVSVRVRRPNDYNPAAATMLGPSVANHTLNLAAIGLSAPGAGGGGGGGGLASMLQGGTPAEVPDRIFVGGLPYYMYEDQCIELLSSFGPVKTFDLVKDRDTGKSKGYGFVVYTTNALTESVVKGLHNLAMGDRTLTVRRATEQGQANAPIATAIASLGLPGVTSLAGATRVVILTDAVTLEEIADDGEYADIIEDMRDECGKHGICSNLVIPRPTAQNPSPPGSGKVIIEFLDINAAVKARNAMHGRKFGGRVVSAAYMAEDAFASGAYGM
ncbi:MAG: hypothetical protein WDW36_001471 [Sanguina aurantia]